MRILIEPTAIMHVLGTKMDFVEDRLKCALPPHMPRLFRALYVCCACCSVSCSVTPVKSVPGMLQSLGVRPSACSCSEIRCAICVDMRTLWLVSVRVDMKCSDARLAGRSSSLSTPTPRGAAGVASRSQPRSRKEHVVSAA